MVSQVSEYWIKRVESIARQYHKRYPFIEYEELYSAGLMGLVVELKHRDNRYVEHRIARKIVQCVRFYIKAYKIKAKLEPYAKGETDFNKVLLKVMKTRRKNGRQK